MRIVTQISRRHICWKRPCCINAMLRTPQKANFVSYYILQFSQTNLIIVKRLRRRQYDPLIIETTIGLVLGPCTALCRLFLKHCTLTNKAVGTIWRALSKPPQRRQGPDLRPLWLLVGTPTAIRPELAFSRAEHSLPYSDVTIYIFAILYLSSILYVYRFLWPLRLWWLLVCCLYKEVYLQIFKCMSFWLHGCCGYWEGGPVNWLTTPVGWL